MECGRVVGRTCWGRNGGRRMNESAESVLKVIGGVVCWLVGFGGMIVVLAIGWQNSTATMARPPHRMNRVPDPDLEKEPKGKE